MIKTVFEKGSVVSDANDFVKETTGADQVEVTRGVTTIDLTGSRQRFLLGAKTTRASCLYLPYAPGAINWVAPQGRAVLSSQFSGCWFAKFVLDGVTRVAHVGTPQCNALWEEIRKRPGFTMIQCFKPTDQIDTLAQLKMLGKYPGAGGLTIGLITADNRCYMGFGAYKLDKKTGQSHYTSLIWKQVA